MGELVRMDVIVLGKVQGVFFRASAMEEAQRLGLRGFVRNLPDGTVEAAVEGERSQVAQFVEWCRTGSRDAVVSDVYARESTYKDEFRTFVIER